MNDGVNNSEYVLKHVSIGWNMIRHVLSGLNNQNGKISYS